MPARRPPPPSFARVGLPFIVFMLGGYYGLTQFVDGKVERGDLKQKSQSKREFSLEEERTVRVAISEALLLWLLPACQHVACRLLTVNPQHSLSLTHTLARAVVVRSTKHSS